MHIFVHTVYFIDKKDTHGVKFGYGSFCDLYVSHPKSFRDRYVLPLDVSPTSFHPPI